MTLDIAEILEASHAHQMELTVAASLQDEHTHQSELNQVEILVQQAQTQFECTITNVNPHGDCLIACDILNCPTSAHLSKCTQTLNARRHAIVAQIHTSQTHAILATNTDLHHAPNSHWEQTMRDTLTNYCTNMVKPEVVMSDPEISAIANLRNSIVIILTANCNANNNRLLAP
jgi:hypothetical protein